VTPSKARRNRAASAWTVSPSGMVSEYPEGGTTNRAS
jgi:hypothetical protein